MFTQFLQQVSTTKIEAILNYCKYSPSVVVLIKHPQVEIKSCQELPEVETKPIDDSKNLAVFVWLETIPW